MSIHDTYVAKLKKDVKPFSTADFSKLATPSTSIYCPARRHLNKSLHAHLEDFIVMREIDRDFIEDRVAGTDQ